MGARQGRVIVGYTRVIVLVCQQQEGLASLSLPVLPKNCTAHGCESANNVFLHSRTHTRENEEGLAKGRRRLGAKGRRDQETRPYVDSLLPGEGRCFFFSFFFVKIDHLKDSLPSYARGLPA